jgi:membrane protein implicated in regulation of membrane protease activity
MWQNWPEWALIATGLFLITLEIMLGAATGFDLALVGLSLATGGAVGLWFESTKVALFASGALAFIYLGFFRARLRSRVIPPGAPSNVDAIIGCKAVVTAPITRGAPGRVKTGDETWRAVLSSSAQHSRDIGDEVLVESVDGVTLIVR